MSTTVEKDISKELIERLRGYPGASLEVLMEGVYGKSYAGLAKEAADEIERLEGVRDAAIPIADNGYAEESDITRLREALNKDK